MKKFLVLILTLVFCLSMAGCTLESMRNSQVFFNEAGNIEWQGQEYIPLPDNGRINPPYDYAIELYATQKDVPLLLQEMEGMHMYASIDRKFLMGWGSTYCRSDCYEEYKNYGTEDFVLEHYGYEYWQEEQYVPYILDEKQTQWLQVFVAEAEATVYSDEEYYEKDLEWIIDIVQCTTDMLVQESFVEVFRENGDYYLRPSSNGLVLISVPETDVEMLESILEKLQ